jgi:tetratricopeptide (TPR) repeat protein
MGKERKKEIMKATIRSALGARAGLGLVLIGIAISSPLYGQSLPPPEEASFYFQQGQELLRSHRFQEAEASLRAALERDSSHCASFLGLLHLYLIREDTKKVRELMSSAPNLQGCSENDNDYLEAVRAEMRGRWIAALDRYEAIAKRDPSDPRPFTYMALIYLGRREFTSGIEACQKALQADPHFFLAHNVLGRLAQAQGNFTGAIAAYEKALEIYPGYPFGHASLGDAYLRKGMEEKARAQFAEAERLAPENDDLLAFIGNSYLATGKREEAVRYYRKSLQANPKNAMVHYFLARIYLEEGKDTEVEEEVELSARHGPELNRIYALFGYLYLDRNRSDRAEIFLKKQLALDANDLEVRNALSWLYFMRGDYDLAEDQAREMIQRNPGVINGYSNLGHIMMEKGMLSAAIEQFQKAISIRAEVAELHAGLAHALYRKGKIEEATAAVEEALKLNPEVPDAHLTLGLIRAKRGEWQEAAEQVKYLSGSEKAAHLGLYLEGHIALQRGESEKAREAFRRAREAFPAMAVECLRGEALASLQRGAFDQAIAVSEEAVKANPRFALSYRDLGLAWRGKGEKDKARGALKRFLELWKDADQDIPEVREAHLILRELGA